MLTHEQRAEWEDRWVRRGVVAGLVFIAFGLGLIGWVAESRAAWAPSQTPAGSWPFMGQAEKDYILALNYWGQGPPPGCTNVTRIVAPVLLDTSGSPVGGLAQPHNAWELPGPCGIAVQATTPVWLCVDIVHEYGHLLGLGHSEDPTSVMYREPAEISVPQCRRTQKPRV